MPVFSPPIVWKIAVSLSLGLGAGSAWAGPAASSARALAPGQPDFVLHQRVLQERLQEADAVSIALTRVHNALAVLLSVPSPHACDSETGRSLAARTRPLGAAYRDAAQAARAEAARVRALLSAPTLVPLLQENDRRRAELLLQRTTSHVRGYQETQAWQQRFVEPLLRHCEAPLRPSEGLPAAGPVDESADEPVAVLGIGGGKICPGDLPADGRVLVLPSPQACYGGDTCLCEPRRVLPGTVLGPAGTAP